MGSTGAAGGIRSGSRRRGGASLFQEGTEYRLVHQEAIPRIDPGSIQYVEPLNPASGAGEKILPLDPRDPTPLRPIPRSREMTWDRRKKARRSPSNKDVGLSGLPLLKEDSQPPARIPSR